jgi:hypothetical protein
LGGAGGDALTLFKRKETLLSFFFSLTDSSQEALFVISQATLGQEQATWSQLS